MILTGHSHHSPVDLHGSLGCRSPGQRASDGEGCFGDAVTAVFAGSRRSALNVFPVHLPRTQTKKP